jgi:hypothetical protein
MDSLTSIEGMATLLTVIGVIYTTFPKRKGLLYLIASNFVWMYFAYLSKLWFFLSLELFLAILSFISLKTWKDKNIPF